MLQGKERMIITGGDLKGDLKPVVDTHISCLGSKYILSGL